MHKRVKESQRDPETQTDTLRDIETTDRHAQHTLHYTTLHHTTHLFRDL